MNPNLSFYTRGEFVFDFADDYLSIPLPEGDQIPFTPSEIALDQTRYVKIDDSPLTYSVRWENRPECDNPLHEQAVDICFEYEEGRCSDDSFLSEMQYLARLQRMMDAGVVIDATLDIEVGVMVGGFFIPMFGENFQVILYTQNENGNIVPYDESYFDIDAAVNGIIQAVDEGDIQCDQDMRLRSIKRLLDEYAAVEEARRFLLSN